MSTYTQAHTHTHRTLIAVCPGTKRSAVAGISLRIVARRSNPLVWVCVCVGGMSAFDTVGQRSQESEMAGTPTCEVVECIHDEDGLGADWRWGYVGVGLDVRVRRVQVYCT